MFLIKANQQISWFSTSNLVRSGSGDDDFFDDENIGRPLEEAKEQQKAEIEDLPKELGLTETPGKKITLFKPHSAYCHFF